MTNKTKNDSNFYNAPFNHMFEWANHWSHHTLEHCKRLPLSKNDALHAVWQDCITSMQEFSDKKLSDPKSLIEKQVELWNQHIELSQNIYRKLIGEEPTPVVEPKLGDQRFSDKDWHDNFLFDYIKQAYLINSQYYIDLIENLDGLSDEVKHKLLFYVRQWINAMSPSNFVATNPEVLRKTWQTGGQNLVDGMSQLNADLKQSIDTINISINDPNAFMLGENLASTPGKVVFQNSLFQLVHYQPTQSKIYKRPLVIVPPWINKYYVLDLREKNSFVRWAIAQGHDTYMISWVNPDKSYKYTGFEDYINLAVIEAIDQVETISGQNKVNTLGYCLGGTLLATAVAYLEAIGDKRIASATYLATLIDFSHKGDLGIFINEAALQGIEKTMEDHGVFDGRAMAVTFNLLRENELYWNYFVSNYLKGEKPSAFDLLYWSSDSTNIPAALHKFVLRRLYLENSLIKPGAIVINGISLDLKKIAVPAYFISPKLDHIAKWESTYLSARAHGKNTRFVLGESGHIAGIINPPSKGKYGHWVNTKKELPKNENDWLNSASKIDGSWWNDWQNWIHEIDNEQVKPRIPENGPFKVIEDAPGSYVKKRLAVFE